MLSVDFQVDGELPEDEEDDRNDPVPAYFSVPHFLLVAGDRGKGCAQKLATRAPGSTVRGERGVPEDRDCCSGNSLDLVVLHRLRIDIEVP